MVCLWSVMVIHVLEREGIVESYGHLKYFLANFTSLSSFVISAKNEGVEIVVQILLVIEVRLCKVLLQALHVGGIWLMLWPASFLFGLCSWCHPEDLERCGFMASALLSCVVQLTRALSFLSILQVAKRSLIWACSDYPTPKQLLLFIARLRVLQVR